MKKYLVAGTHTEWLLAVEIEANDPIEAEDYYIQMWDRGELKVSDSDMQVETKEIKP